MGRKHSGGTISSSKNKIVHKGETVHVKNYCLDCGAEAQVVKFAKSRHSNQPSGMLWVCKENSEHINRTRKYELVSPYNRR